MRIGVPKEIKEKENRVAMTPEGVKRLLGLGHKVVVENGAGAGSGFSDLEYHQAGAEMASVSDAWDVDLVVKVKEPLPSEYCYLNGQIVFTFFHLSGVDRALTLELLKKEVTAIAYETLEDEQGRLPILAPMSAVAGNMATLIGSYYLASFNGGRGVQLATVLGKSSGKVLIVGDGVVGLHAAKVAAAMGAVVYVAGLSESKFNAMTAELVGDLRFVLSAPENLHALMPEVDLVVGAVLIKGAKAPKVITDKMIMSMQDGSVVVDVSIDQGGCFETSRPTTHSDPVFIEHDVLHYCVTNMPGAYPRTSTIALTDASIGYVEKIASRSITDLLAEPCLAKSINTYRGKVAYKKVAEDLGMLDCYQELG